ncbi:MAG: DUF4271 domain-containing protein [Bacteroidia bacterium]|nr:DUF4271 domain-containing protein [Bacteroidia bacterium]
MAVPYQHIIEASTISSDSLKAVSIFKEHLLTAQNNKPIVHFTEYHFLIAIILFISYGIYVWLFVKNRKRIKQIIKAFYLNRYANQLAREESSILNRVTLFLSILFLFSISLFFTQVISYYGWKIPETNESLLLPIIAVGIVAIYLIKIAVIQFLGFVFKTGKEAAEYTQTLIFFINALGLFLLPIVICIAFAQQIEVSLFINIGIGLISIFILTRVVRGIIIGVNSSHVSNIYLFLYLCTLEILPFIIMLKLFLINLKQ